MKKLTRNLLALAMMVFLCVGGSGSCLSVEPAIKEKRLQRTSASALRATIVTPHLEAPIQPATNVLWCGSFPLAWNELRSLAGGEIRFLGTQPELAAALNRESFNRTDLDDASYVALAGFVRDGIYDKLGAEMRRKFGGKANPALLPSRASALRPQDIAVYAYLFKQLAFATPFEKGDFPVPFDNAKVACFGMGDSDKRRTAMERQTLIVDYVGPDDFIVELKTTSPGDRLILAKIAPEQTLAQTVTLAQGRVSTAKPQEAWPGDRLVVPKIHFDITRSYSEIIGLPLVPTKPGMADDLRILAADQETRFQMDEQGVRLESEARMLVGCAAHGPTTPKHVLIFDKPFLVMLSRKDAKAPYFALWVGNAELLVQAE